MVKIESDIIQEYMRVTIGATFPIVIQITSFGNLTSSNANKAIRAKLFR